MQQVFSLNSIPWQPIRRRYSPLGYSSVALGVLGSSSVVVQASVFLVASKLAGQPAFERKRRVTHAISLTYFNSAESKTAVVVRSVTWSQCNEMLEVGNGD